MTPGVNTRCACARGSAHGWPLQADKGEQLKLNDSSCILSSVSVSFWCDKANVLIQAGNNAVGGSHRAETPQRNSAETNRRMEVLRILSSYSRCMFV